MKRGHRRAHLLIWIALAPATLIAGVFAWLQRPAEPVSILPEILAETDRSEAD